ncbi:MAG: glycosyl hydrolase, partial [Gemmatimonadota bacterium]|nr:glycosyl hydrolase [Gemmatimonadota bacterium]
INPHNTDIMVEGDDGGATVTLNGGRSWSTQRNQATAELYRVTMDDQFPYRLYGAQQDNSTVSVPSRVSGAMISDFEREYQVGGCESGHIAVDPRDTDIVYSGCFGGSINRYDVATGQAREILAYPQNQLAQRIGDLKYRFQWNAPIRISPHDPDVLYHTSNHVHRSRNGGQSWEVISPDLTTDNPEHQGFAGGPIVNDGTGVEVYGTIFAFEESPHEAGVLWAGSDDGRIHVSRDDGESWTDVTPADFPDGATVNSIDISRHARGRVHVAAYKYRQDDMRPYVFRTEDYGASWSLLTTGENGIPADHFTRVVREDPVREGLLFAGTEFGMHVSVDAGAHWQSLQRNLPVTPVTDIQIHQGDMVLSTQGRSFWIMDDLTPLRSVTAEVASAAATLHDVRPAYRAFFGGPGLGALGATTRATNPPDGAWFHYTLGQDVEGVIELVVTDAAGDTAVTLSSEAQAGPDLGAFAALAAMFGFGGGPPLLPKSAGTHRAVWGLTYSAPTLPSGTIIFGALGQPPAPPGEYAVTLTVDGESVGTQTFEVLPDPRTDTPRADYLAQHQFLQDLGGIIDRLADQTADLVSVRGQVETLSGLTDEAGLSEGDQARVNEAADSLTTKLTGLQEEIQQTDNRSFYDPLDNPGKLAAELAFLYNTVAGGLAGIINAGPTDQAVDRLEELRGTVADVLGRLDMVFDEDLSAFNELVRSLGMDPVVVSREEAVIS